MRKHFEGQHLENTRTEYKIQNVLPEAAMYVEPTVFILSIDLNLSSSSISSKSAIISLSSLRHSTPSLFASSST